MSELEAIEVLKRRKRFLDFNPERHEFQIEGCVAEHEAINKAIFVLGQAEWRKAVADHLDSGVRDGAAIDEPQGARTITLTDTFARQLARNLRGEA